MTSTDRFQVVPAAYLALLRGPEEAPEVLLQLRSGTGFMDGWWACAAAGLDAQRSAGKTTTTTTTTTTTMEEWR